MTDAPAQSHLGFRRSHVPTPTSAWRRRSVRQTSLFQPPPPHAHAHTPPHHCAYAPRPVVHCTPLAHAADRWRSVCTMTDAPAQSHLGFRRSHVPTPTSAWRRRSVRQTSLFQPPPPHAHAHTPPHHCAYAPRPVVHCTPLAHAADRWRSVCTMTDAPAQSRL